MSESSTKTIRYVLLLLEGILVFGLGIFGNKIADAVDIPAGYVLLGAGIFMLLLFTVTIILLQYDTRSSEVLLHDEAHTKRGGNIATTLGKLIFSRAVTTLPAAIVGSMIGALYIVLVPTGFTMRFFGVLAWGYEVLAYFISLITLYAVSMYKQDRVLTLAYALGFAISITGTEVILRPAENNFGTTLLSWTIMMSLAGLIIRSRTVQGFVEDVSRGIENLIRPR